MYFEQVEACSTQVGDLMYIEKDYALDFFPEPEWGDNFVLGYLNFIFDSSTRCASYVEGLFYPRDRWIPQALELPC